MLLSMVHDVLVVEDEEDIAFPLVRTLERLSRFYMSESCGQCTPCREGTGWLYRMLTRIADDLGRGVKAHRLRIEQRAGERRGVTPFDPARDVDQVARAAGAERPRRTSTAAR